MMESDIVLPNTIRRSGAGRAKRHPEGKVQSIDISYRRLRLRMQYAAWPTPEAMLYVLLRTHSLAPNFSPSQAHSRPSIIGNDVILSILVELRPV